MKLSNRSINPSRFFTGSRWLCKGQLFQLGDRSHGAAGSDAVLQRPQKALLLAGHGIALRFFLGRHARYLIGAFEF